MNHFTLGVEVAAGELARLRLGEGMAEFPLDLERDIFKVWSQNQSSKRL